MEPVDLFYSYAHEDEPLRDELDGHLALLRRKGVIRPWHDRGIVPGQQWDEAIDAQLASAVGPAAQALGRHLGDRSREQRPDRAERVAQHVAEGDQQDVAGGDEQDEGEADQRQSHADPGKRARQRLPVADEEREAEPGRRADRAEGADRAQAVTALLVQEVRQQGRANEDERNQRVEGEDDPDRAAGQQLAIAGAGGARGRLGIAAGRSEIVEQEQQRRAGRETERRERVDQPKSR